MATGSDMSRIGENGSPGQGAYWRAETTLAVFDLARKVCRAFAVQCNKASAAKAIAQAKTVAGVERLAKADRIVAATFDQWDSDNFLFNAPSQGINLEGDSNG
jgi:putative DNA primase/helicase